MKSGLLAASLSIAALAITPALAQDSGAPAAPSGASAPAAKSGSSTAGEAASKHEMSSHKKRAKAQKTMANPHKKSM